MLQPIKMKLYHGSPKKLTTLKPQQAKGTNNFENQKAIYLCKTFTHAALYALGKTLKGKTKFAISPRRLYIVGKQKPTKGYVYEINIKAQKGPKQQYSHNKEVKEFTMKEVKVKDYEKNIKRFNNLEKLKQHLKVS